MSALKWNPLNKLSMFSVTFTFGFLVSCVTSHDIFISWLLIGGLWSHAACSQMRCHHCHSMYCTSLCAICVICNLTAFTSKSKNTWHDVTRRRLSVSLLTFDFDAWLAELQWEDDWKCDYLFSTVNLSPRGDVTAFLWPQAQPDTVKDHLWSRGWITQHLTFYNNRQTEQYILNLYILVLLALQRLKDIKGLHFRKFQLTRFAHLKGKIYTFLFWHKIAKVYTTFRGSWGSFNMSVCCDQTHLQNRKHISLYQQEGHRDSVRG